MSQEFIDAATQGDVAKVKEMLRADPSLAQSKDQNGVSVILKATYYGKHDVLAELLATGVQLDIFEAVATGQTNKVVALINEDPTLVNTYSPDGFTPPAPSELTAPSAVAPGQSQIKRSPVTVTESCR